MAEGIISEDNIAALEARVRKQSESGYDKDANFALLKHYQFFPSKTDTDVVKQVLLNTLMQLPNTDFLLCLYMIPNKVQSDESIAPIIQAHDLLERAEFKEFWAKTKAKPDLFNYPGFFDAIRKFIAGVISRTYRNVSKSDVEQWLDVSDVEASAKLYGWEVSGNYVVASKDQVQQKPHPTADIRFEQFTKILQSLQ